MSPTGRLRRAVVDKLYGVKRRLLRAAPILDWVGLRRLRVVDVAHAQDLLGRGVENLNVLIPGGPVSFAPEDEPFLRVSKYYSGGTFERPDVFVCDVPSGFIHVGTGLVLTAGGTIVEESVLAYRLPYTSVYQGLRPLRPIRIHGSVATIFNVFGDNFWHWLVDSLPRLVSLRRVLPAAEPVTLVLPDTLHAAQREVLSHLLPTNFSVRILPKRVWVRADRVILPSFLSGRANGFLPADYVNEIRGQVFRGFGLPETAEPRERIWVSREGDRHRRVRNEGAVMEALAPLGFRSVRLAGMSAREQVEMFRTAEIVVGTYGAGLGWLLFSGRIPVVILYPNSVPNTHFITQTSSLGQRHHFLLDDAPDEYTDFDADVPRLRTLLEQELARMAPASEVPAP
jgi:hypothetical protein